ncbi:MAG: hypothetical protein WCZ27_07065 [Tissierellaceae bacterium]
MIIKAVVPIFIGAAAFLDLQKFLDMYDDKNVDWKRFKNEYCSPLGQQ